MVVQNDHYIDDVFLAPGTHEITSETEFAMVAMRIRANQSDPDHRIAQLLETKKNGVDHLKHPLQPERQINQLKQFRSREPH